ncbi:hypothetical protein PYW07_000584 [Mythimna separata]|uniref:Uncharacterized protein n=1 Tax=Mythimna separata TaxID=271217 RepID=A0AAD7Z1U5_MYTSE|nr:hypothetical protein PYW07_000584 [Mythimna separata]
MDEEQATIDSQFVAYAKLFETKKRTGETITLWNSDYWMRQANLIDDRKVTMTDTGIIFNKYGKSEINFEEWLVFLAELCEMKNLDLEKTTDTLTNCGLPGEAPVEIPQYRNFFTTYKSKNALEGSSSPIYCNATCDGYLCWPATPAGESFFQNCPKGLLSNENMCAFRRCGPEGLWLGRHLNDTSPKGWTNYTPCFPALVQKILDKVNEDEAEAQLKFETAVNTRTIEMVGIASSFLTICAAVIIFNAFPSLHNRRTVIHRHLFYALLMEVTVRMVLYTQQSYSFDGEDTDDENTRKGIEYFPYVCEGTFVLLEYSRLVVYGWMFIEGIFLNTLISANTLRNEIPINYFYVGGWGVPAIVIAIWATVVGRHYSNEPLHTCWYGYNYLPSYYIIQGPILAIVLINMLFLGTIMSVIVMKLRRTNDSELRKIQKTIRATLILLPLLGIINIFNLFDYPLDGSSTGFAIWAYFTHFFRSFQGVFISFIYCFSNGEVRKAIKKKFERRTWFRFDWPTRPGRAPPAANAPEHAVFAIDNDNMELVPMQEDASKRTWARASPTHSVSDLEAAASQHDMAEQPGQGQKPTKSFNLQMRFEPSTSSKQSPRMTVELEDEALANLTSIQLCVNKLPKTESQEKIVEETDAIQSSPEVVPLVPSPFQDKEGTIPEETAVAERPPVATIPEETAVAERPPVATIPEETAVAERPPVARKLSVEQVQAEVDVFNIRRPSLDQTQQELPLSRRPSCDNATHELMNSRRASLESERSRPHSRRSSSETYRYVNQDVSQAPRRQSSIEEEGGRAISRRPSGEEPRSHPISRRSSDEPLVGGRYVHQEAPRRQSSIEEEHGRAISSRQSGEEPRSRPISRRSSDEPLVGGRYVHQDAPRRQSSIEEEHGRAISSRQSGEEPRSRPISRRSSDEPLVGGRYVHQDAPRRQSSIEEEHGRAISRRQSGEEPRSRPTSRRSSDEPLVGGRYVHQEAQWRLSGEVINEDCNRDRVQARSFGNLNELVIDPNCPVHNPNRQNSSLEPVDAYGVELDYEIPECPPPPQRSVYFDCTCHRLGYACVVTTRNKAALSSTSDNSIFQGATSWMSGIKTTIIKTKRPKRSSSCIPHTMPRRARNAPFVRPGLVTRENHPTSLKAISSCF